MGYVSKFDDRPTSRKLENEYYSEKEYISEKDCIALGLDHSAMGGLIKNEDNFVTGAIEDNTLAASKSANDYFSDHILLNIKHYFQVCHDAGMPIAKAQKCIMIGLDFDGLINAFTNINTVQF